MGKMGGGGFETLLNNKNKETNIKNKFLKKILLIFYFFLNYKIFLRFIQNSISHANIPKRTKL